MVDIEFPLRLDIGELHGEAFFPEATSPALLARFRVHEGLDPLAYSLRRGFVEILLQDGDESAVALLVQHRPAARVCGGHIEFFSPGAVEENISKFFRDLFNGRVQIELIFFRNRPNLRPQPGIAGLSERGQTLLADTE